MRTPVTDSARIETLDVLRGFAVLGILMVNAAFFAWPWQSVANPTNAPFPLEDALDRATWFVAHVFFENKFVALFSMLFGASLLLLGGERADAEGSRLLRRRLGWLAAFGLAHGVLIWFGDILLVYAITGLLAMRCRSWSVRRLLVVGVLLAVVAGVGLRGLVATVAFAPPDAQAELAAEIWSPPPGTIEATIAAMQGGLVAATRQNVSDWAEYVIASVPLFYLWYTLGLMLVGMALFRHGFLQGRAARGTYLGWIAAGVASLAAIAAQAGVMLAAGFPFPAAAGSGQFAQAFLSPVVTLAYVSGLVLLWRSGVARALLQRLAAVGRMAFTNYIAQSVVMTTVFWSGRGLGLYGEVDRPALYALVLAVWTLQLAWSPWWLRRYRMGPLEWAWRRLVYGQPLPLRHAAER